MLLVPFYTTLLFYRKYCEYTYFINLKQFYLKIQTDIALDWLPIQIQYQPKVWSHLPIPVNGKACPNV